jgi:O-antigen/teichoic acid export membrane protein
MVVSLSIGYYIVGINGLVLIAVLAGFRLMDGVYEWTYGFYVNSEKGDRVGLSQIFRSLALLIPIGIGLTQLVDLSIVNLYLIVLASLAIVFITIDRRHLIGEYKSLTPKNSKIDTNHIMRSIAVLALPLGLMGFVDSISLQIPKYAFKFFGMETMIGVFTSIYVFVQTTSYLGFSVVNSTMTATKEYFDKGNRKAISNIVSKSSLAMIAASFIFIAGVYLLGHWALEVFYTPEIASYSREFFYLSFISIPIQLSLVFGFTLFSFGAYRQLLGLSLVTAISIFLLCLVLIPKFSLLGGILGFSIGQTIKCLLFFFQYRLMLRRLRPTT